MNKKRRDQIIQEVRSRQLPICGARRSADGRECRMQAGWGTDHPGVGRCRHHGGSTLDQSLHSASQKAAQLGAPMDISPADALTWVITLAAGEVEYFNQVLSTLEEHEVVGQPTTKSVEVGEDGTISTKETAHPVQLNVYIRARRAAMKMLADFSAMALRAGVEERQVRIAERIGETIANCIRGILDEIRLSKEQQERAPQIVRRHLTLAMGDQKRLERAA